VIFYLLFIPYWVEYQARRLGAAVKGLFAPRSVKVDLKAPVKGKCAACAWLGELDRVPYEDVYRKCHE
jgi:hypothetical protein